MYNKFFIPQNATYNFEHKKGLTICGSVEKKIIRRIDIQQKTKEFLCCLGFHLRIVWFFAGFLECIIFAVRLTCGCFPCLSFPVRKKASVFIPFGYTGASLLYMNSPRTHLSECGGFVSLPVCGLHNQEWIITLSVSDFDSIVKHFLLLGEFPCHQLLYLWVVCRCSCHHGVIPQGGIR